MFHIEYRTISRLGLTHPVRIATLGIHKAGSIEQASEYFLRATPNVEIVSVKYVTHGI